MINRFTNNNLIKSKINRFYTFYYSTNSSHNNSNNDTTTINFDQFFQRPKPKINLNSYNNNNNNNNINNSNQSNINNSNNNINHHNSSRSNSNNEIIIKDKYIELYNEIKNHIKDKKDQDIIKLILSKPSTSTSESLIALVLSSKSIQVTKIYQKLFNLIIQHSTINKNNNNHYINSIIKELLYIINDNHSQDINIYTYDESEDFENDDNYKISKVLSELIFYNEIYQKRNNQIMLNDIGSSSGSSSNSGSSGSSSGNNIQQDQQEQDQDQIYQIISNSLKEEFIKLPFKSIKEQAIINLIMLFLQMGNNSYHLALKWLSIGVQDNISIKLLYKCFYLYHINKSNTNRIKKDEELLYYWMESYSSLNNSNSSNNNNNNSGVSSIGGSGDYYNLNDADSYIKENERYFNNSNDQYITTILNILNNNNNNNNNSINLNNINDNNNNHSNNNSLIINNNIINNYYDEYLESLISSINSSNNNNNNDNNNQNDLINNLKEYLDNKYFKNQIIPNGKQLIIVSELIKSKSNIAHTFWYNHLPEFIKPMLHHYSENHLIVQDIENGLRVFINKEGLRDIKHMEQLKFNNELLTFIIFGLIKTHQYQLANSVLDQLVYNLYYKPISNSDLITTKILTNNLIKHLSSNNVSKYFKQIDPILIRELYDNCELTTQRSVMSMYSLLSSTSTSHSTNSASSIPSSLKYHLPIELANLALLSLIKQDNIEQAYKLFELIPRKDAYCLRIGLSIYSKMYPIPPIDNFLKWETIRYHYKLNSINTELLKDSILITLFKTGNQDLIEMLYNKGAFNVSRLSQESLLVLLKSFESRGNYQIIKSIFTQYPSLRRYNASLLHYLYHININYLNDDQINNFIQIYKETMINDLNQYNNNNQQTINNNNNSNLDKDIVGFIQLMFNHKLINKAI